MSRDVDVVTPGHVANDRVLELRVGAARGWYTGDRMLFVEILGETHSLVAHLLAGCDALDVEVVAQYVDLARLLAPVGSTGGGAGDGG